MGVNSCDLVGVLRRCPICSPHFEVPRQLDVVTSRVPGRIGTSHCLTLEEHKSPFTACKYDA